MQSLAPSEYFEGIKFNYSFYTTGDTKVTLEYVNNNFLKCVGYAYSRAISTSFNGILYCLGGIDTTTITASGLITSSLGFAGSGAQLTNLNAASVSDGTLNVAYSNMIALLIEGMKEQQSQIDKLREDLEDLRYEL